MKVVIIGSGNVATVLGKLCIANGHQVLQVVSRNADHAKILADELGCSFANDTGALNLDADLYLFSINDAGLAQLNDRFSLGSKLVVHTAGSVSKDVLSSLSLNHGVLYPLQSLRKEMAYKTDIPFLIDGSNEEAVLAIEAFAATLSNKVSLANDQERLKLHVAAVVVSNFTNHLFALAEDFCNKEGVDFKLLVPLIKETAERTETLSPTDSQTGPAVRNDVFTLEKHIRLLTAYPKLKYMYLKLTDSIISQ